MVRCVPDHACLIILTQQRHSTQCHFTISLTHPNNTQCHFTISLTHPNNTQVRIIKQLQELEKMFYGSSMAYDAVRCHNTVMCLVWFQAGGPVQQVPLQVMIARHMPCIDTGVAW